MENLIRSRLVFSLTGTPVNGSPPGERICNSSDLAICRRLI